ncbi:hypothetical protein [Herbaspirillum sp. B65]|jgi:hypothetical protein|uniref:hypothetical protein n=1 Tax=Herbaspirillum sp. B65 TaxID=137708 RepID=UPI00131EE76F|nr:hypothetical protein [Herbaspirillum sp. B65]
MAWFAQKTANPRQMAAGTTRDADVFGKPACWFLANYKVECRINALLAPDFRVAAA